ncbi:hypothetical protein MMC34_000354 [Xylographa carneopallida]|nr:hypothetical protein [Xylographa carneopallida]
MLLNEKEFGMEVLSSPEPSPATTPTRPSLALQAPPPFEQHLMASQCPTPTEEYDPTSTHPFSAFYSHPTTRTSFEQLKSASTANVAIKVYETDLESGSRTRFSSEPPASIANKECSVWPRHHQLVRKNKALKQSRGCSPLSKLSKKQKLLVKILIALFIVGAVTAIAVGVSKAVNAGVYKSNSQQTQIGST